MIPGRLIFCVASVALVRKASGGTSRGSTPMNTTGVLGKSASRCCEMNLTAGAPTGTTRSNERPSNRDLRNSRNGVSFSGAANRAASRDAS